VGLRLYHLPRFRGRENLPEGPCVICGNHSGFADPLWVSRGRSSCPGPWPGKASSRNRPLPGISF
jgi:1-acyl-sn-glycerol-3-phosphate acyltransferase